MSNDKSRLASALKTIYEIHQKPISESVVGIWWHVVKLKGIDQVLSALTTHTMQSKFLPKPADVMEILDGDKDEVALSAWYQFNNARSKYGTGRSLCFADPLINQVVEDMGGYQSFGMIKDDELKWTQIAFEKAYKTAMKYPISTPAHHCIGREEAQNSRQGFEVAKPVLIGNPEQAKQNYLLGVEHHGLEVAPLLEHKKAGEIVDFQAKLKQFRRAG